MPKEHIEKVLGEIAKLTSVLINAARIKDNLDAVTDKNGTIKALEDTKVLVKEIHEKTADIKERFNKQYHDILEMIEQAEKSKAINSDNSSSVLDSAQCDESSGKANGTVVPKIKLVDINKLVEPKLNKESSLKKSPRADPARNSKRKSVQFNQSVVVISSSEDESTTEKNSKTNSEEPASAKKVFGEKTKSPRDETKGGKKRKRSLIENVTLPSSSESSDSDKDIVNKNKSKTKPSRAVQKKRKITDVDWEKDVKFKSKPYVDLLRIPCEKMKEYYAEKFEMLEVLKLTRTDNLEKIRLDKRESENRRTRLQRSKLSLKHAPKKPVDSKSSDDESDDASDDTEPGKDKDEDVPNNASVENALAESILHELSSDNDVNETKLDTDPSSEDECDKKKNKSKSSGDKERRDSAKVSSNDEDEDSDHAKESEDEPKKKDCDENTTKKKKTSIDEADESENKETNEGEKQANNDDNEKNSDEDTNKTCDDKEKDESVERESNKKGKNDKDKVKEKSKDDDTDKSEDSEDEERKKKDKENSKWKKDKLLTVNISSSDSEKDREKMKKKKKKKDDKKSDESDEEITAKSKTKKLVKKKVKKAFVLDSDSDGSKSSKDKSDSEDDAKKDSPSSSSSESEKEKKQTNKRKRVKHVKDSSDDDDDKDTRKQIRRVWGRDSLAETTKKAEEEEKERKARIADKQKKYNNLLSLGHEKTNAKVDKIVLDFDEKTEEELLKVDEDLVKKLKPHQANGVRFMWEACFESLERSRKTPGSGCILAHCMGLGKTLQVIALAHTLLTNFDQTKVKKIMVVSPLNTVLNWVNEFKQWLPDNDDYEVYELVSYKQNYERQFQVKTWHNNGGVLIIGYDMFRNLSNPENKRVSKKMRTVFYESLVDPGPDLVICDEGHLLKNEKTNISIAMNRLKTLRRIVLTGTPLQNNLKEYFCMVQFIKPNLLGTYKEYLNRFVNPITNGQYTDSTLHDIQIMRKRSHVLHKMLDGIVQRRDYSVLQPYLPPKHEYVLFLTLSDMQIKLYEHYRTHMAKKSSLTNTSYLFVDFQAFQRICTHPRVLLDKSNEEKAKEKTDDEESESEGSLADFIDDDDGGTTSSTSSSGDSEKSDVETSKKKKKKTPGPRGARITRAIAATAKENGITLVEEDDDVVEVASKEWWQEYCDGSELDVIAHGSKLFLLFEILKECEEIGDKVLVFSQSLYSLNVIEYFLDKVDSATERGDPESVGGYTGNWHLGLDYFRLDGSSSCDNRNIWCKSFNNPKNTRARLFLISTRAGGLGINLVAANRVIIFDVSWNPSHDIQSIYRVYRFGQTKPCYIYRFVTYGTMEMKIYERQVTKQAISKRVIDEQQIDRHYNQTDLAELYQFDPKPDERPIPLVPKDVLLGEMLQKHEDRIFKYHEHQSLLENKEDETLNEEERKAAWEEFESEKVHRQQNRIPNLLSSQALASAMISLVRKDNPDWNDNQIRSVIPALSMKLQAQLSVGDFSMYKQIQAEVQLLNQMQQQKLRMQQLQNQYRYMNNLNNMQLQEQEARMDLSINPAALYPALYPQVDLVQPGTSTSTDPVIDLND